MDTWWRHDVGVCVCHVSNFKTKSKGFKDFRRNKRNMDNVEILAKHNASRMRIRRREEIDETLPYFEVIRLANKRYDIRWFNYEKHDNASRVELYTQWFKNSIFPNIDKHTNISGFYNFELHDGYAYLENEKNYNNVFTFSSPSTSKYNPGLMVDPYFVSNFNGLMNINDTIEWKDKSNKVCFFGTTTGNKNPSKNERIDICLWSLKKKNIFDFGITKIAQMDESEVRRQISNFTDIYRAPVPIEKQLEYKFHLSVDGNVSRFDKWAYKTNCLNLKLRSPEELFYYPLMPDKQFHIEVDKTNIEKMYTYYLNNSKESSEIIARSKIFAAFFFRPLVATMYGVRLFEDIAEN